MIKKHVRTALSHPSSCGLSRQRLGELIEELAPRWQARCESGRHGRRRGARRRHRGAGPKYELAFTDRVLATLVHLRPGLTHEALAVIYEVGSSTIGRGINEIRPLLAERGFAVPGRPGLRLRTLADVFAYAEAENVTLRIDGTETQVRRPQAHRPGRRALVSGKRRQNTIKTTTIGDQQGRTLYSGAVRPGRMHDQTAIRTEGIAEQLRLHPEVKAEVDEGYRGLAKRVPRPDQCTAAEAERHRQHAADRGVRVARAATPAIFPPDLRRARQRRASAVAAPPAVHRTTRGLRRDPPGRRRPGLRPPPPGASPDTSRAPNSYPPARWPAEQPPAEPQAGTPDINRGAARKSVRQSRRSFNACQVPSRRQGAGAVAAS
ncbi:transposase family protein [Streptomyces yokosukanensis]|uniref:transposase family protein n=1 Tax=Streptomyces yokosukanensis TaxID=67386 RepID=UPI000AA008CC